jgi:uncharacterized protein YndB with AHSA1/START domain
MKNASPTKRRAAADPGMSDEAVSKKTGRTWSQWVKALDTKGCAKMKHPEIARVVGGRFGVGDWWAQMVTVGYERLRGLREKHERADGYNISASRTIPISPAAAFAAWSDPKIRGGWLPRAAITVRSSKPHKTLRITWKDGKSTLEIGLWRKHAKKTQVVVQHSKLSDSRAAAAAKKFWAAALARLEKRSLAKG